MKLTVTPPTGIPDDELAQAKISQSVTQIVLEVIGDTQISEFQSEFRAQAFCVSAEPLEEDKVRAVIAALREHGFSAIESVAN